MNPQGGQAEEGNANTENNESDQMSLDWFPEAQMNLLEQGPSTGAQSSNIALESNNSPSSSLIGTSQEGAIRSPAMNPSNIVAPGHVVQEQGMHGGTSADATHSRVQSIVDELRNGRFLMFQEFVLEYSFLLHGFEDPNLYSVSQPYTGLSVETIMQHIKRENFVFADKENLEDEEKCAICLEKYEDGDEIGKLDLCVHKYHVQCIKQWLMHRNECPICKQIALTI